MGVTNLWSILAPVKQHTQLSKLQGQTIAVDLSIWVCENQCVKSMQGVVARPYLRNLFFRVSYLTQLGVRLVFVIEGAAPQLKWQEMQRRQQALGRGGDRAGKGGRGHFNARLRECCQLLDLIGIPYVQSHGEAEAMCAALNAAGLVDACITDDGDVFLYGARTVYKNFTMNSKDPHVESYSMTAIEKELGIPRESLVGVALLLGCDYLPGGVSGVGVDRVIKYLDSIKGVNLLRRFHQWKLLSASQCVSKIEIYIRQRALAVPDFPQKQIIAEFISTQEVVPTHPFVWRRPHIKKTQEFAEIKMEWPPDYTVEKVLPLVTLWDLSNLDRNSNSNIHHLKPIRIVKPRVRHGVPVYEVEWHKEADDTMSSQEFYVTMEEQSLFSRVFPHLVRQMEEAREAKKHKKKTGGRRGKKAQVADELDEELSGQLRTLELSENFQEEITASLQSDSNPANPLSAAIPENQITKNLDVCLKSRNGRKTSHRSKKTYQNDADCKPETKYDVRWTETKHITTCGTVSNIEHEEDTRDDTDMGSCGMLSSESIPQIPMSVSVDENGDNRQHTLEVSVTEDSEEEENEDVFLTLSQRLQLKLGQTTKLRSMSSGFETCLSLKQNQKKCNSESAVSVEMSKNGKTINRTKQAKKEIPKSVCQTVSGHVYVQSEIQEDSLSGAEYVKNENVSLSSKPTEVVSEADQTSGIQQSRPEVQGLPDKSLLYPCKPLDATVRHDFSHVADMMTIINTPEVLHQTRTTRDDSVNCESSFLCDKNEALMVSDVEGKNNPTTPTVSEADSSDMSLPSLSSVIPLAPQSTSCSQPDISSQQTSFQMQTARAVLCPLTPGSADLPRGKVLLYQTPSPQTTTLHQKFEDREEAGFLFRKPQCHFRQTPSPLSLTTVDVTLQLGNFSMQASLLSDSPANLATDSALPSDTVQQTYSKQPDSKLWKVSDCSSMTSGSPTPSAHCTQPNTATDSPDMLHVSKFQLPPDQQTPEQTYMMESDRKLGCYLNDLDSSFSALSLGKEELESNLYTKCLKHVSRREQRKVNGRATCMLELSQNIYSTEDKMISSLHKTVVSKEARAGVNKKTSSCQKEKSDFLNDKSSDTSRIRDAEEKFSDTTGPLPYNTGEVHQEKTNKSVKNSKLSLKKLPTSTGNKSNHDKKMSTVKDSARLSESEVKGGNSDSHTKSGKTTSNSYLCSYEDSCEEGFDIHCAYENAESTGSFGFVQTDTMVHSSHQSEARSCKHSKNHIPVTSSTALDTYSNNGSNRKVSLESVEDIAASGVAGVKNKSFQPVHESPKSHVSNDSVCNQTTFESPISLMDRLKTRLSSNAQIALQTLSTQNTWLNVKPWKKEL